MNYIQESTSRVIVYGHTFLMVGFSGPMVRGASPLEVSQTWPVPEPELFSSNLLGKCLREQFEAISGTRCQQWPVLSGQ